MGSERLCVKMDTLYLGLLLAVGVSSPIQTVQLVPYLYPDLATMAITQGITTSSISMYQHTRHSSGDTEGAIQSIIEKNILVRRIIPLRQSLSGMTPMEVMASTTTIITMETPTGRNLHIMNLLLHIMNLNLPHISQVQNLYQPILNQPGIGDHYPISICD